ncbi:MAG: sulfite exporter TauE/SafE family protein [Acidobacteriota bacterium]
MDYHLFYILPVVFLAYFFKGTTGFGSAIILVATGSAIIGPVAAVTLVTLLDVVGGAALLRIDQTKDSRRLWLPLALALVAGAVVGALLLKLISLENFKPLLGAMLILAGVWMIFLRGRAARVAELPETYRPRDIAVCLVAGAAGGLTGLSGPPLIFSFGASLRKEAFRRILTRIFWAEALAKAATYTATGVLKWQVVIAAALAVPVLYLGLYAGNHVFFKISETWFGRIVGAAIIVMGARLII